MTKTEAEALATQVMLANPTATEFQALQLAMKVVAGEKTAANDILTNKPNILVQTGRWIKRTAKRGYNFVVVEHPTVSLIVGGLAVGGAGVILQSNYDVAGKVASSVPWKKEPTIAVKGRGKM